MWCRRQSVGRSRLITLAWRYTKLNAILAFWMAYILTRPLGASIGDELSQKKVDGGLGLGTTITSLIFLVAIAVVVAYLTSSKKDQIVISATELEQGALAS